MRRKGNGIVVATLMITRVNTNGKPTLIELEIEPGHSIQVQPYEDHDRNEQVAQICCDALNSFWDKFSEDEYEEYRNLKRQAERIQIFDSMQKVTNLEDDIDLPIKRCVAAFALLGCQPRWSCCGFDYVGQPLHKYHQYGRIYFILAHNPFSEQLCKNITESSSWEYTVCDNGTIDFRLDATNVIPQWNDPQCPHYHEPFAAYIQHLETYLYQLQDLFADQATLCDTNNIMTDVLPNWQYKPMEPWIIRKEDWI